MIPWWLVAALDGILVVWLLTLAVALARLQRRVKELRADLVQLLLDLERLHREHGLRPL